MKWNCYTITAAVAAGILALYLTAVHSSYNKVKVLAQPEFVAEYTEKSGSHSTQPTNDRRLEHWLPDWYEKTDIVSLLNSRLKGIKERCRTYIGERNKWRRSPPIVLRRSPTIDYCATAKAGSTFWKCLLAAIKYKGVSYTKTLKVTTMRNPWHRLVSTYLQKFVYQGAKKWKAHMGDMCVTKFDSIPTFTVFVKHCVLAKWKRHDFDIHWLPTTERCNICNGHYDYVVAVENMNVETTHILNEAGIRNPEDVINKTKSASLRENEKTKKSASYQSYYRHMDKQDMEILRKMYSFEIYVLQYPHSPFVDFSRS